MATARTQLERATASWSIGDHLGTERLVTEAYSVIHRYARANDVSRCWLYMGLTRMAAGGLQAADQCWEHAERHWRELGRPLHIHRILLQRSWIAIVRGRYQDAIDMVEQARDCLDSSPRSSWLAYARLDDHLGTIWRADALADLGFDAAGDPDEDWTEAEARYRKSLGVTHAEPGTPEVRQRAGQARQGGRAEGTRSAGGRFGALLDRRRRGQVAVGDVCLRAPARRGVRRGVGVGERRAGRRADRISQRARNVQRGAPGGRTGIEFSRVATAPAPMVDADELASVAGGPRRLGVGRSLTRLGPLPPLQMDPTGGPLLAEYRELALAAVRPARHRGRSPHGPRGPDRHGLSFFGSPTSESQPTRVCGSSASPTRTVTWVVEEPLLLAALAELADALPEPMPGESGDRRPGPRTRHRTVRVAGHRN